MQRPPVLGVALIVGALGIAGWTVLDTTGDDVGALTVGTLADPGPAQVEPDPTPTATADDPLAAYPSPPVIGRNDGSIEAYAPAVPVAPTSLSIGAIGVDAPVVPVGVDDDGLMGVPEDVSTVGWYRFGNGMAADEGTIVVAGHVDSSVQGRGAFFDLRALDVGDEVTVTDEDGTVTTWAVTGRRTFEKDSLPVEDLYRRSGPRRLVLITCGGDFDSAARSYESNVVVEAEPVT